MHIYIYSLVFIFIYLCLPFVALVFSCMSISVHLPKIVLGIVWKSALLANKADWDSDVLYICTIGKNVFFRVC